MYDEAKGVKLVGHICHAFLRAVLLGFSQIDAGKLEPVPPISLAVAVRIQRIRNKGSP
jgi:hypothetical protein